jgi:hypothetical protein
MEGERAAATRLPRRPSCGSGRLDEQKRVAVLVAEEEHRRHRAAHSHALGVDVDSAVAERGVGGAGVVGRQADPGLDADGVALRGGTSAIAVAVGVPVGATSIQRSPSPYGTSMRFSKPSVPT